MIQQPGKMAAIMAKATEDVGRRERTFSVGRLVNLLPFVLVLEHGRPQRGGRGNRQEVSETIARGASGPEAFSVLFLLLMTHFHGVDTDESYTKLHNCKMCNGMPFPDFSREIRVLVSTATWSHRVLSQGTEWCWRWFGWRRISIFRLSCFRCTLVRSSEPAAIRLVGCYMAGF